MMLHPDWQNILRRAWSVRMAVIAGLFSGVEVALPLFSDTMPRNVFAVLALVASIGSIVARTVAQPRMHK